MKQVTGKTLKIIACVTMLIDHIGAVIIERTGDMPGAITALDIACRLIGRVSFPLFCFLLAEGARHTSNKQKYLLRLIVFALISEIPYDLAMSGTTMNWTAQNVYFTMSLGLLTIFLLENTRSDINSKAFRAGIITVTILIAGLINEYLLRGSYGFFGIVTITAAYLFRNKDTAIFAECISLSAMSIIELPSLAAIPLIHRYSGERGTVRYKWLFYLFYPAHLLVLALISACISR